MKWFDKGISRREIKFLSFIFLAVFVASCEQDNFTDPNAEIPENDGIILNFNTTFQSIDHFGASGGFQDQWVGEWPAESKEPIAELLFSNEVDNQGNPLGIGLTLWRTVIGDGAADQINSGFSPAAWFRETESYLNSDLTYDWSKQQGEQWFLSKAKEYGVEKFSAWATTPPYFLTENGYTFSTNDVAGFNCPEENYQAYADFLAEVMNYYASEGYDFETVSAFNETQYEWNANIGEATQSGTKAFNAEIAEFLRVANAVFDEKNVSTKLMISEAAQLRNLYEGSDNTTNQIEEFFNSSSPNYIGDLDHVSNHVAGHSYFSNATTNESVMQRRSLRSKIEQMGSGLDYWQTEYSILGSDYQQNQNINSFEEIDYALWLAKIIHTDLVFGNATGWSFWTALNQSSYEDHPFRFNLIFYESNVNGPSNTNGSFTPVKNLWALGNYSRFVRPDMLRFEVVDPDYRDALQSVDNFMISGYKSNREIVLVLINRTGSSRAINFEGYGDSFSVINDRFEMYTTSGSSNLERTEVSPVDLEIPAKSIVTLKAILVE
ncbi:O-Glycosyl hydrolase [Zunongwangia mangrovi]|uniref:O-Glycosyl hydrolase n=1 Tax=Zunongwangia mangrovi TaxID=1334022 RepID=A0A1I1MRG0_9FLAO|nr:glycoside hydrolase [Zunongwangia mangrovi]SFC87706.1 O-Glycosyl hydrolase [Zunongwangia mangrovi]